MFEKYNQYFGRSSGHAGMQYAAYNTKLQKSMMVDHANAKKAVLAVPDYKEDQHEDKYYILESEAAVLYHSSQHAAPKKEQWVRVINMGKTGTDITLVRSSSKMIKSMENVYLKHGGDIMTDKMTKILIEKLGYSFRLEDAKEVRKRAEELKVKMSINNKKREVLTFREKSVTVTRKDFSAVCAEWFLRLLMELDFFDQVCAKKRLPKPDVTIICGGVGECQQIVDYLKRKYEGSYVTNYKAKEAAVLGAALYAKQIWGGRS